MTKPIRLIVEPVGDNEIRAFRFAIPEVPGAVVSIPYESAMILADRMRAGGEFDSVDPYRRPHHWR